MTRVRDVLASIGAIGVGMGILFVVQPGLASALPLPRLTLVVIGLLAGIEGVRSIQVRRRSGIDGAEPPNPELGIETPAPGDEFDQHIARWSTRRGWIGGDFDRVESRLRTAAIGAVAAREGIPRHAARGRIADGSWTDVPVAAAFLGGPEVPEPPLNERVRMMVSSAGRFEQYAARTADAITALREAR